MLLLAASPIVFMKTGVSGVSSFPNGFESKQAFGVLDRQFSAGRVSPVQIVVDGPVTSPAVQSGIARLKSALATDNAFGPVQTQTAKSGTLALLSVPVSGDSVGNLALSKVRELRSTYIPQAFAGSGAHVYVTGQTAGNVDYIDIVNRYFPWVFALVLSLSFILLMVAFRSIVIPAKAIVMNLLSVGAAYGLITLVSLKGVGAGILGFQKVDTVEQWVPLFLFAVLFGLSMDYQVFLLSRIKEAWDRTGDNTGAVTEGVGATAGIITGAALIMVAVFAGFAAGDLVMFQQMGFGLAVAVLLDATLIRTIMVPAAMKLLGGWNWYLPSWLQWLPHLSIEGAPQVGPAQGPGGGPAGPPPSEPAVQRTGRYGAPTDRSRPEWLARPWRSSNPQTPAFLSASPSRQRGLPPGSQPPRRRNRDGSPASACVEIGHGAALQQPMLPPVNRARTARRVGLIGQLNPWKDRFEDREARGRGEDVNHPITPSGPDLSETTIAPVACH